MINVYLDEMDMKYIKNMYDDITGDLVDVDNTYYWCISSYIINVKCEYNLTNGNIILPNGHVFKVRDGWVFM